MLNELMNIIKEFATHKNRVWFYNSITMQRVEVKKTHTDVIICRPYILEEKKQHCLEWLITTL